MTWTRPAYLGLAWLFVLFVLLQFYFAGYGLVDLGADASDPDRLEMHQAIGFAPLHLIPILMVVVAAMGKMGKKYIGLSVLLLILVVIQPGLADEEISEHAVRALHALNGLLIALLGFSLAHMATREYRASKA